jgi:leucyl aminopeptidase
MVQNIMKYGFAKLSDQSPNSCHILGVFDETKEAEISLKLGVDDKDIISSMQLNLSDEYDNIWHSYYKGRSIFIINCGKEAEFKAIKLTKIISIIANFIFNKKIKSTVVSLPQVPNQTPDWQVQQMIIQFEELRYQFFNYKTADKNTYPINSIQFELPGASDDCIAISESITKGIKLTKDLANSPANICTPTYLAEQAIKLSEEHSSLRTKVLSTEDMQKLGMGSLLAVGQGSKEPAKLIEIKYNGNKDDAPVVLVGKGVTFDSGGISIKPSASMEEMKFDMCGAASVLGTLKACSLLKLPINVIGILACAENMPDGAAIKPGDVVTSLSGQTIEITNTDAEGRLVLADALTYVERFKPKFVLDIATLTGAVIVALGNSITGLMTNDDELADIILDAASASQEKTWRLPLDSNFNEFLESPVADMVNSPAVRVAGSSIAASFLSKFTKNYRWGHLDIAGTAWVSGKNRTASGRPVPMLIEILTKIAHES